MRVGVPWSGNQTETVITSSPGGGVGLQGHGDAFSAVSSDGRWVAFSRYNGPPTGGWSLWKVPIGGGTPTHLTSAASRSDEFPGWSPDGQTIYFQRADEAYGLGFKLWKIPAGGGTEQSVFLPSSAPDSVVVVQPALSPDGKILLAGFGPSDDLVRRVVSHTLDPALSSPTRDKLIANYPDTTFAEKGAEPYLSPRLSPDGTRTALSSKQVWAGRRNMNKPPVFTDVGGAVSETTTVISKGTTVGVPMTFTVSANDPEGDALTYTAYFLFAGMSFDSLLRTFSWTPGPISCGKTYYVKFVVTTASGGTDAVIGMLSVAGCPLGGPQQAQGAVVPEGSVVVEGPNPTTGSFAISTPTLRGITAQLTIFDVSGRRVATLRVPSGSPLVWRGKDDSGRLVPGGIYLYRIDVSQYRQEGKLVVVR
jgi:hypothetical protein